MTEECIHNIFGLCWQPADRAEHASVFGFAEFLTIVAIFSVAYNISDHRYKFRIGIAPIPLLTLLFHVTIWSAATLVAISIWFDYSFLIPSFLNDPRIFEVAVAIVLLTVLLLWLRFAYLKPPLFSRQNGLRFAQQCFQAISGGNPQELAAAAFEIGRSARELVKIARQKQRTRDVDNGGFVTKPTELAALANDVLALAGDKRFCRHVAKQVPWVAEEIFREAGQDYLGEIQVIQFSRNISSELLADPDAAIHHEDEWYSSGLIGHIKPMSVSIFGNSKLVEELADRGGSPLNPSWQQRRKWTAASWETYNRLVLLFLDDRFKKRNNVSVTTALHQIFGIYEHACLDSYRINDMPDNYYEAIEFQKIRKVVDFINGVISLLEKYEIRAEKKPTLRDGRVVRQDIFDELADIAFNLISASASVDTAEFRSWEVQHNSVWSPLMRDYRDSEVRAIFRARLQRLLWKEICDMERFPNLRGAKVIMVCLNIMGFKMDHDVHKPKEIRALKRSVITWVRKNYSKLREEHPKVAEACLGGSLTYDPVGKIFIKTYSSRLGKSPDQECLLVN